MVVKCKPHFDCLLAQKKKKKLLAGLTIRDFMGTVIKFLKTSTHTVTFLSPITFVVMASLGVPIWLSRKGAKYASNNA